MTAPEGYCFTLDDNIRFFEGSQGLSSIFNHPYPRFFREMHEKYGAKFQFNLFYRYAPGGFSLDRVPDARREELESCRDWLRFSFHSLQNAPAFPYREDDEALIRDYRQVMAQIRRFAGSAAEEATTTVHYVAATARGCRLLRQEGVRALIGMFADREDEKALRYYLTASQAAGLRQGSFYRDPDTDIIFVRNDLVLNTVALGDIVPILEGKNQSFYQVMIHEQYFYPDYNRYQPDFRQKVEAALAFFARRGLPSRFLGELI